MYMNTKMIYIGFAGIMVDNVEEVSPKETAEAMIKLYELLKKEIK